MTLTLIPELQSHGSSNPVADDAQSGTFSRSTREVAGGIVRECELVRGDEPETGWSNSPDSCETSRVRKPRLASPLIRLPAGTLPREKIRVLQKWEGVVTEITEDSVFADLQDLSELSLPIEVVEIPIEEISEDDRHLLIEGAVFYWSIGYETSAGGQLRRMSEIRLRRTPRWTKRAIQQIRKRAEELFELNDQ